MNKLRRLDSFHLKLIGMLTMVIDHLGVFFFPKLSILRIIGRISFPLFAFITAESMVHTRNKLRYILVLAGLDISFSLVTYFVARTYNPNVFSILALSSLAIYFLDHQKIYMKFLSILPLTYVILATFAFTPFKVEYGIYGFLLCVGFHLVYLLVTRLSKTNNIDDKSSLFSSNLSLFSALFLLTYTLLAYYASPLLIRYFPNNNMDYYAQGSALLAVPFIFFYSGKRGYSSTYFRIGCYVFYPLHILLFYFISLLI